MAGNQSVTREYDRIFTIVKDEVQPYLFDNISSRTALLYRMKDMGAIITTGGKPHLRFNILKELPTAEGYTDLDTLTPVRADPYTSAIFEWKQVNVPVQISGRDIIRTGDAAVVDLVEAFVQTAEISMRDAIGGADIGIFSDADEDELRKITGLQNFFTTSTTTGTCGGLNRATLTAWRHNEENVAGAFDTNGLNKMRTLYRECSRFDESPDSIVLTGSAWENYLKETTATFRVNEPMPFIGPGDQKMVEAGFPNVRFFGALVFYDDACPANKGYFLNLAKYIRLYVREGRNAEIGDFIKSRDKDDLVTFVLWAGNLITTNLARGGLLQNADDY